MTNKDMVISYKFDTKCLNLGGYYKVICSRGVFYHDNFTGILVKISPDVLTFYIPNKHRLNDDNECTLERRTVSSKDFYEDSHAIIIELK